MFKVVRRQGPRHQHHRLAPAAELVHGEPRARDFPRRDGRRPLPRTIRGRRSASTLRTRSVAGLDIVTDGDCRFDHDVGGQSWALYPARHMAGFDAEHPSLPPRRQASADSAATSSMTTRGARDAAHRWADRARQPAVRGDLEGRTAADHQPVKFGTITPELLAFTSRTDHYGTCASGSWRSATRSTRSCTSSPTPAAR